MKKQTDSRAHWILFALLVSIGCNSQRGLPKAEEGSDAAVGSGAAGAGGNANGGTGVPSGGNAGVAGKGVDQPDAGDQISPPCTLGEMQCTNNGIEECRASGWVAVMACTGFCLNAKCVDCKPDAKQCKTDQPEVCDAKGAWTAAGARCDSGCNPTTGLCNGCPEAGKTTCTGKQVYKCSADKKWVQDSICTAVQGCVNGACTACDPGVSLAKCEDTTVSECGTDGLWKQKSTCAKGCVGATTSCRVCTPNTEKRCSPSAAVVEKCNDAGNGWVAETTCPALTNGAGVCTNATCGSPTCNGGFTMCKDGTCRAECPGIYGLGFWPGGRKNGWANFTDFEGSVVVGDAADANSNYLPFRWSRASGMKALPLPANASPPARALGINRDGSVVVGSAGGYPVAWATVPFLIDTESKAGYARSVSSDGTRYLVEPAVQGAGYSWLCQAGVGIVQTLVGSAVGMSEDAKVILTKNAGCFYLANSTIPKASDGNCLSSGQLTQDGKSVIGVAPGYRKLSRWKVGTATVEEIELSPTVESLGEPFASFDGKVVLGYATVSTGNGELYYIWTESGGFKTLPDLLTDSGISALGWGFLTPREISGSGKVIVGVGTNSDGDSEPIRIVFP